MSNDYNGKKRSELPDSVFGIPQERKYPMPDEKHTRSAIKLFNHVDPKYEEQLAKAVIKNMKKYGIDGSVVGPNNRLRKYLPEDMIKESMDSLLYEYMYADNDPDIIIQESGYALTWRIMPILLKAVLSGVDQYDYKYLREKKLPAILKKCKTMDDIKYMRRDAITAKTQLEILKRNVHAVNTNDEQIMKRLNKSFIKKVKDGKITEKEIDTHIRWLGTEYKKLIDARAKEIKDSIKESTMNESEENSILPVLELQRKLSKFKYGVPINGKIKNASEIDFGKEYKTLTSKEFEKYEAGVCWDFANYQEIELAKIYGRSSVQNYYFIVDKEPNYPTHTITIVKIGSYFYYPEASWGKMMGVYRDKSISHILNTVAKKLADEAGSADYVECRKYSSYDRLTKLSPIEYMNKMNSMTKVQVSLKESKLQKVMKDNMDEA